MKLLILFQVWEGDKNIAPLTLGQFLTIVSGHENDVLIFDDASPSRLGDRLATLFGGKGPGRIDVLRSEHSTGYTGTIDRLFEALHWVVRCGRTYDYIVKVEPDVHFCRRNLASLFDPGILPEFGIVGPTHRMALRHFVQVLADLLPAGIQRRRGPGGTIERDLEFKRFRPVWWQGIGWRALLRRFTGVMVPFPFVVISCKTLAAMNAQSWFDLQRSQIGAVFADDVVFTMAVQALGHGVVDISTLLSDWSCNLFISPTATAQTAREYWRDLIHPMKDTAWANALREELPLLP